MGKSRVNKSVQNWLLLGPTTQPPIPYFCTATICYSLTTVCDVLQSCTYFITISFLLLCHYMCWMGIHPFDGSVIHPIKYIFLWCSWHILIQYYFLSWNTKFHMFWVVGCCVMAKVCFGALFWEVWMLSSTSMLIHPLPTIYYLWKFAHSIVWLIWGYIQVLRSRHQVDLLLNKHIFMVHF